MHSIITGFGSTLLFKMTSKISMLLYGFLRILGCAWLAYILTIIHADLLCWHFTYLMQCQVCNWSRFESMIFRFFLALELNQAVSTIEYVLLPEDRLPSIYENTMFDNHVINNRAQTASNKTHANDAFPSHSHKLKTHKFNAKWINDVRWRRLSLSLGFHHRRPRMWWNEIREQSRSKWKK